MNLIDWKPEFCIGAPQFDKEHEELVHLINVLYAAVESRKERAEISDFFEKVIKAIGDHFAHEEQVMRQQHYPEYDAHKADHERLLVDIKDIAADFAAGVFDYDPERTFGDRISSWFLEHTQTHDLRLCKALGEAASD